MHEVAPPYLPPYLPTPYTPPTPPPTTPPYTPPRNPLHAALPPPYLPPPTSPPPTFGSLRLTRGPVPAPPLNKRTPAVATDRLFGLVCAPPSVCTALPIAP